MRKLLDWGINPNRQDKLGRNSLHMACRYLGDNSDMINLLFKRGVSYIKKSFGSDSPIDTAISNRNVYAIKCLFKWWPEIMVSPGHSPILSILTVKLSFLR